MIIRTVTASYSVKLRRPTPNDTLLCITSQIKSIEGDKVEVELLLEAGSKVLQQVVDCLLPSKKVIPYHRWS